MPLWVQIRYFRLGRYGVWCQPEHITNPQKQTPRLGAPSFEPQSAGATRSFGLPGTGTKRRETLVEAGDTTLGRGLALLSGVHRMRRAGHIERNVRIGVAIAVLLRAVSVNRGTDQEIHIGSGVMEQDLAVLGVDIGFHGSLQIQMIIQYVIQ